MKVNYLAAVTRHFLLLLALVFVAEQAMAQVLATRSVEYNFIVSPRVVSLAHIEELRAEGAVVNAWMIVIPDKTVPNSDQGNQIINALTAIAERLSQTYNNKEEFESAFGHQLVSVGEMIDFSGAKLKLNASFENNPVLAAQLSSDNFIQKDSTSFELEGETITLTRWIKREGDRNALLGTASAILNLEANPSIGDISSIFNGNFTKTDSSKISATDLPISSDARELARARYEAFRKKVNDEFNEVLAMLNKPQSMLSNEERLKLSDFPEGTEIKFNRTISFEWFDEEKEVKIIIKAILGPLRLLNDEDESEIAPYQDD